MLSRGRNALSVYESHHGPNMTPMVDVVMVILIFFMASAAMLGPEWFLNSGLARANAAAATTENEKPSRRFEAVLLRGADGKTVVKLNQETLGFAEFCERVRGAAAEVGGENVVVVLSPTRDAGYDDVVAVHELCATLGIGKVGLGDR